MSEDQGDIEKLWESRDSVADKIDGRARAIASTRSS